MFVQKFIVGPLDSNTYLVVCEKTKKAAVIDPAPYSFDQVDARLNEKGFRLQRILITHSHWDHIADAVRFKRKFNSSVEIHADDKQNLISPGSDRVPALAKFDGLSPDRLIVDEEKIRVGEIDIKVIHTPGHTPGSVCFYCSRENVLFSGDTLFKDSIGNLSLPTSSADKMWESLEKLSTLPPQTTVYPGHGESTTLGDESWLKDAREIFGY